MSKPKNIKQKSWKRFLNLPFLLLLIMGITFTACDEEDNPGPDLDPDSPEVVSTSPDDGAIDIPVNSTIEAAFSEEINNSTVNESTVFLLYNDSVSVDGALTYASNTITFTPENNLQANTEYSATITTGIEDESGNNLEENYNWSFTTTSNVADTSDSDTTAALQDAVDLGSTEGYAILSRNAITDSDTVNFSSITGNVGISPGASTDISGFTLTSDTTGEFSTAPNVDGRIYASDYTGATAEDLLTAENDLISAYENSYAETRGTANPINGDLNAQTLTPGLYEGESIELSENGVLTLDAEGDEDAVFIMRSTSSIDAANGSEVRLTGGAQPQNVYWVADNDVNFGEGSISSGTYISGGSVNMNNEAQLNGRLFLQGDNGDQVNLNNNTITVPGSTDQPGIN